MSVNFVEGVSVKPGQVLGKANETYFAGDGVLDRAGKLISLLKGVAQTQKDPESGRISVQVTRPDNHTLGINIGDEIIGRVQKIKKDNVFVNILAVNGVPLSLEMDGVIKRKDIREKEVDKINMEDCFVPGDILKAHVSSYGDSRKIQLNTHEHGCGVLFAKSEETGQLLFPIGPGKMVCPITGVEESRKVAIPDLTMYEEA